MKTIPLLLIPACMCLLTCWVTSSTSSPEERQINTTGQLQLGGLFAQAYLSITGTTE